ncbi:hypothetical protein [Bremerella cremea]|uniref:hypothetical protein n=1 Tax=Bremerella cremea TaxID=1031537 RepID=UPI0031F04D5F
MTRIAFSMLMTVLLIGGIGCSGSASTPHSTSSSGSGDAAGSGPQMLAPPAATPSQVPPKPSGRPSSR